MKRQKLAFLAFSLLLLIAAILGCGTVGTNFLLPVGGSPAPTPAARQFAFVVNVAGGRDSAAAPKPRSSVSGGLTISAYSLDSSTGKLTMVPGSPFTASAVSGTGNMFIDVDPAGHFLYVPNRSANSVSVFSIASDGVLSPLGSPAPTNGTDAFAVKVHPSGKYLYVANQNSHNITAFSIGANGVLTRIGNPVDVDFSGEVHHLFMDPKGRFLYAGIWSEGCFINGFVISPTDGSLTKIEGIAEAGDNVQSGTVDSTGNFLLVANKYSDNVNVYRIDQSTGGLSEVTDQGSPFDTGIYPFHVAEFAVGNVTYMAVTTIEDGTIWVYTFDRATGKLTPAGDPADLGLSHPAYLAVDHTGKFGYIVDGGNDRIVGITVGATGEPVTIPGSPFSDGGLAAPVQIVIANQQ